MVSLATSSPQAGGFRHRCCATAPELCARRLTSRSNVTSVRTRPLCARCCVNVARDGPRHPANATVAGDDGSDPYVPKVMRIRRLPTGSLHHKRLPMVSLLQVYTDPSSGAVAPQNLRLRLHSHSHSVWSKPPRRSRTTHCVLPHRPEHPHYRQSFRALAHYSRTFSRSKRLNLLPWSD